MSRILIVEDEVAIADLEKDYLELSGFEVEIENDGTKGLERALHEEFDLFILDLMLPGVDGFEICKKIRETKNTPILMVSAKKDDIDKIRGLGLGADDYVTKPFSPSELVARVKAHLARYERLIGSNMPQNDIIEIRRRVMGRRRHDRNTGASGSADHTGTGVPSVSEPFLSGAIREVTTEHDRDSLLAGTMPFAPFIALGTLVAFVA